MEDLFGYKYTQDLFEIDYKQIRLRQVCYYNMIKYQKNMSRAIWRPSSGRKMGFGVYHADILIGLIFLSSPVINLKERDDFLNLSKDATIKGYELKNYADLSICVGIQPLSWYWNLGKLIALLATSKEIAVAFEERYSCKLKGITTTSLYGKGTQYNRIYKFLGYTKGFGHEHISDKEYFAMLKWMKKNGIEIPSCKFGEGSNARMRRIAAYKKARGEKVNLFHGNKRGIYFKECLGLSVMQISEYWYNKFGKKRYDVKKNEVAPYSSGIENPKNFQKTYVGEVIF